MDDLGAEPSTSCLSSRRSPVELIVRVEILGRGFEPLIAACKATALDQTELTEQV